MADCKPVSTPVDCNPKLSTDGVPVQDATDFRSLAGALQYLTFTRPDIAYAVQQIYLYMHDPREPYLTALKRILSYIRGTLHMGLVLRPSSSAKQQNTVSRSSAKAEYRAVANAVAEAS
ncbi:uncharacterized mitochondrial protein AtMg00810-like [Panicum virgatum]|uniref:uncharacterized mitochondrial protein AtMg00810-like n=1 Tax=Panicum virgatum TaxID=38727 RepID=UPI0019D5C0FD|nr:uncharacterized mitochondrial protein AtMg00810-like [Panicum virgatum]